MPSPSASGASASPMWTSSFTSWRSRLGTQTCRCGGGGAYGPGLGLSWGEEGGAGHHRCVLSLPLRPWQHALLCYAPSSRGAPQPGPLPARAPAPQISASKPYYICHYTYGNDFDLAGTFTPGGEGAAIPWVVQPLHVPAAVGRSPATGGRPAAGGCPPTPGGTRPWVMLTMEGVRSQLETELAGISRRRL
jgi:hypothetical protein